MNNFTDILDKPAEEIKAPPPIPTGTYLCVVDGPPEFKEQKNFKICEFKLKIIQAFADVDDAAFREAGGAGRTLRHGIFLNDKEGNTTDWALLQFLENYCGIEKTGKTLRVMLPESAGKQVLATVIHKPSDDGSRINANIKSVGKV